MKSQMIPAVPCPKDKEKEYYEPWRNFVSKPVSQNLFYFVSTEMYSSGGKGSYYTLWKGKEISEVMAFTHPIAALICRALYETSKDDDCVWLLEGRAEDDLCSIDGRVGLQKAAVLKKMGIRLTTNDAFKVVGGTIMKIHQEKAFTEWFVCSIGDRNEKNYGGQDISSFGRKIAEKHRENNDLDKSYEYLAAAHIAEYKDSKDQDCFRRRKLAQAFWYALYAAHLRGKDINVTEVCEKTLTLIRTEEVVNLPMKIKDEDSGWSRNSLHS